MDYYWSIWGPLVTAAKSNGAPANQDSEDGVVAAQIVLFCSLMLTKWDIAGMYLRIKI